MTELTDDEHTITMPDIQRELKAYGVTADRKSLYDDLEQLRVLGIDVIGEKVGKYFCYHVGSKQFEIAELKLLVDAIQSSKFITAKKSNDLIRKLTSMASKYEADLLKRQVTVQGRVKTMNESIYYFVDDVHRAIAENRQLSFEYMKWNLNKKMEPHRGEPYVVSPWAMTWTDENYYLIAYDEQAGCIKHFRVDKMKNIRVLNEKRTGRKAFKEFDLARYAKMNFSMFGGEKTAVRIEFADDYVGVMIDRFGRDITIYPSNRPGWSETVVDVALSDQFLGWIFALGTHVRIVSPESVVQQFREELKRVGQEYE